MQAMSIKQMFTQYEGDRSTVIAKAERHAQFTLPYIMPVNTDTESEMQLDWQSLGAQAVNTLSNKMMMALFSPTAPFFRLHVSDEAREQFEADGLVSSALDEALSKAERQGYIRMNQLGLRTELAMAMQQLIICGNTLLYVNTDDNYSTSYNMRDYIIKRDLSGKALLIITRDRKSIYTIPENLQYAIPANKMLNDPLSKSNEVELYTMCRYNGDGTYEVVQAIEDVTIEETRHTQPQETLRWIPLTWKLPRGRDYGVGLVEDFSGEFHGLGVMNEAIHKGTAAMLDIKGLADPTGELDTEEYNNADTGEIVNGREGDLHFPSTGYKANDFQIAISLMERHERAISAAFLLTSNLTRDAERVTAEEIRMTANELDQSNAGVYSRQAHELQTPLSHILMSEVDLELNDDIKPIIITGIDALSRMSDRDNMMMFFQDLALLAQVPENLQMRLDDEEIISFFGAAHSVNYQPLLLTQEEFEAAEAAELEKLQAMAQAEQPPQ